MLKKLFKICFLFSIGMNLTAQEFEPNERVNEILRELPLSDSVYSYLLSSIELYKLFQLGWSSEKIQKIFNVSLVSVLNRLRF